MNKKTTSLGVLIRILVIPMVISCIFSGLEKSWADTVIDTMDVGNGPRSILFSPSNNNIYVANYGSHDVSAIDSSTNRVIATIPTGINPNDLEYNPSNGDIYVTDGSLHVVHVIDSSTNTVAKSIPVGYSPTTLLYNPSNGDVYVANTGSSEVYVIDSPTNNIIATIPVGYSPNALEYNPSNGDVYVANTGSDDVSAIDSSTNTVAKSIPVGNSPNALEYNPSNGDVYVANRDSPSVSVIDSSTNAVIDTIDAGGAPWSEGFRLEYNQNNGEMFVTNAISDSASAIDSSNNEVIENIPVGQGPLAIKYNPSNGDVYVANFESDDVSVISTKPPVSEKPVAHAGPNQAVQSDDKVQLEGGKSSDPNGSPLTYSWTQTSGPRVTLDDSTSETPAFTAPQTTEDERMVFQLTVTNEEGESSEPDSVTISVSPTPQPPNNLPPSNDIQKLIDTIDKMNLSNGVTKSLKDPLDNAIKQLDKNNDVPACRSMDAFLNQVDTKENKGQLISQQAADLRQQATGIQLEIGCPSLSPLPLTSSSSASKEPRGSDSIDANEGAEEPATNPSDSGTDPSETEIIDKEDTDKEVIDEPATNPSDSGTDPSETEIIDKEDTDKPIGHDLRDAGNSSGLYRDFFDTGRNVDQEQVENRNLGLFE